MTEDQEQRLKQIERWMMLRTSAHSDPYADLSRALSELRFVLTLLDSQAEDYALLDNYLAGIKQELGLQPNSHLSFSLDRYRTNVATQMRDACLDAVKSLRSIPHGAAYNNAVNDAIHKVESLTLDHLNQSKEGSNDNRS